MTWPPKISFSWYDLRDSLWYRPALLTIAGVLLSFVTIQLDYFLFGRQGIELPFAFGGGAEGARGVLSAIASTMITVATTAFSITLVALQLASSQFSPRILRNFTGDTGNQLVLGIFIATFAYSLLVLRSVRAETEIEEAFVPTVSVSISVLLAFTAIGSLIYFFHHATRTIQASVVINRTFSDSRHLIEQTARRQAEDGRRVLPEPMVLPEHFGRLLIVKSDKAGYLHNPHIDWLLGIAHRNQLILELHVGVGKYINPGIPLVSIWHDTSVGDDTERESLGSIADSIREGFDFGIERTLEYDPLFGMQQLSDISLLALSPGTNDPTTAHSVIDRIGTSLIDIERICGRQLVFTDKDGAIRMLYPIPNFEDYARLPFDQIRHYGAVDPLIVAHVMRLLGQVASVVSPANAAIAQQLAVEMWEGSDQAKWVATDIKRVTDAGAWAIGDLEDLHYPPETGTSTVLP